ncbi:lipid-binding START domain-containing protein [Flammeovirgaceae bacterium 311]|nr:lipid-binding START domain-containing protein [Flammeovirgaceae bacterium 311]
MKYFLLLLLLMPLSLFSQQNWVLKKDQNGIQVFMREVEGSPFKEVRVKMKCQGTLESFKKLVLDVDNHKKWVYNTKASDLIKPVSENEVYYYTEFHLPWPVSNRDLTCRIKMITDSIPDIYFIKANSVQGLIPPKDGKVRVVSSRSSWKVTSLDNRELDIEYSVRVDPAGSIPPWLVNLTGVTGPFNTFTNLKEMLKDSM